MKEKLKYLIPVIIILGLAFPKPTSAVIFTGFFDYFEAAFSGVEEFAAPIAKWLLSIFFYYIAGLGALLISSSLLQMIIENPNWLSVSATNNPLVFSGWSFIAGLTNMFFILLFVFIALATILKIETFAAKKLLPKLLIVAILVNFSLVFVGIPVDISNIFYRTIIGGSGGLVPDILESLVGSVEEVTLNIVTQVIILVVLFIIPVVGPFAQLGLVIAIVSTGFIGMILIWLVQGMMCFLMSGILFTYVFLFIARNYVIQFLAMMAPIAFISMVLPKTKKFWDEWLNMLVEWNVFGVLTLLLLVVGLRSLDAVMPGGTASINISYYHPTALLLWKDIPAFVTYYLFLFIYLTILLYFSKKYTPELGKFIIGQAKAMGTMLYQRGIKPLLSATKPAARKTGQWAGKKVGGAVQKWGKKGRLKAADKIKTIKGKKTGGWFRKKEGDISRAGALLRTGARKFQGAIYARGENIGGRLAIATEESEIREIEEASKETEGKTKERQSLKLQSAIENKEYPRALGITEAMMKDNNLSEAEAKEILVPGSKAFKKIVGVAKRTDRKTIFKWDPDEAMKVVEPEKYEEAEKKGEILKKEGEKKITEGKELKERAEAEEVTQPGLAKRISIRGEELIDKGEKEIEEGTNQLKVVLSEFIEKFKPSDVKLMSANAIRQKKHLREAMVDTFTGNQMAEVGRNFGRSVVSSIQEEIESKDFGGLAKKNPTLTLWLYGNTAQNLGFSLPSIKKEKDFLEKHGEKYKLGDNARYTKSLVKGEVAEARKEIRMGEEKTKEKEKFLEPLRNDFLKMFETYHSKTTFNKQKEFIQEFLDKESDGKAKIPPKLSVERMVKSRKKVEKKLKTTVPEEHRQEIVNRAVDLWRDDVYKGKALDFTQKYINIARKKIAAEKKVSRSEEKPQYIKRVKNIRRQKIDKLKKRIKTKWEEALKQKEGKEFRKIVDRTIKEVEGEITEKLQEETTRQEIYEELKSLFDELDLGLKEEEEERIKKRIRKMWGRFPKEK